MNTISSHLSNLDSRVKPENDSGMWIVRVNSYKNVTEQRLFTHLEMLPG